MIKFFVRAVMLLMMLGSVTLAHAQNQWSTQQLKSPQLQAFIAKAKARAAANSPAAGKARFIKAWEAGQKKNAERFTPKGRKAAAEAARKKNKAWTDRYKRNTQKQGFNYKQYKVPKKYTKGTQKYNYKQYKAPQVNQAWSNSPAYKRWKKNQAAKAAQTIKSKQGSRPTFTQFKRAQAAKAQWGIKLTWDQFVANYKAPQAKKGTQKFNYKKYKGPQVNQAWSNSPAYKRWKKKQAAKAAQTIKTKQGSRPTFTQFKRAQAAKAQWGIKLTWDQFVANYAVSRKLNP